MLKNFILHYTLKFRKENKPNCQKEFFHYANDVFKRAISSTSWCLYVIAILLIASCLYYLYFERRRRLTNHLRVQEIQHIIEKTPPKRRPGAVTREREIFRNVLKAAHSYIYPEENRKVCVVRQTRSGTIYGKFVDGEE